MNSYLWMFLGLITFIWPYIYFLILHQSTTQSELSRISPEYTNLNAQHIIWTIIWSLCSIPLIFVVIDYFSQYANKHEISAVGLGGLLVPSMSLFRGYFAYRKSAYLLLPFRGDATTYAYGEKSNVQGVGILQVLSASFIMLIAVVYILRLQAPYLSSKNLPATNAIKALGASVTKFQFFESGYDITPHDQRVYTMEFPQPISRYLCWELNLDHPKPQQQTDFEIRAIYRQNGIAYAEQNHTSYIKTDWNWSYHSDCWGWSMPGNWRAGIYSVELYVDDEKVAEGTFEVIGNK